MGRAPVKDLEGKKAVASLSRRPGARKSTLDGRSNPNHRAPVRPITSGSQRASLSHKDIIYMFLMSVSE
jgi:hypothetical protein